MMSTTVCCNQFHHLNSIELTQQEESELIDKLKSQMQSNVELDYKIKKMKDDHKTQISQAIKEIKEADSELKLVEKEYKIAVDQNGQALKAKEGTAILNINIIHI